MHDLGAARNEPRSDPYSRRCLSIVKTRHALGHQPSRFAPSRQQRVVPRLLGRRFDGAGPVEFGDHAAYALFPSDGITKIEIAPGSGIVE